MIKGHVERSADRVRLRGTRDGVELRLPSETELDDLISQVIHELTAGREFLRDATVHLTLGERQPDRHELDRLLQVLRERGIATQSITVSRTEHLKTLRNWGLDGIRLDPRAIQFRGAAEQLFEEGTALYVKRTLRSGATIHGSSDVVILGDVNAGAEVTAAGDIIVWGVLRGTVHAGSTGDDTSRICALRLQPTQLRIGSYVARPPDGKQAAAEGPQSAYIQDAMIVVEPWRGLERRGR